MGSADGHCQSCATLTIRQPTHDRIHAGIPNLRGEAHVSARQGTRVLPSPHKGSGKRMETSCTWRNSSIPHFPPSFPKPDSLIPPKGA